jgi:hypothetical protein
MKLNGMLYAVARATKRVACNASQRGVGTETVATKAVIAIGREAAPTFFWGGKAARAKAEYR